MVPRISQRERPKVGGGKLQGMDEPKLINFWENEKLSVLFCSHLK
jgi:hypothetical protein